MKNLFISFCFLIVGSFLFQGFQCASPEFSAARRAYVDKDYKLAKEKIDVELKNNPSNDDALLLLADIKNASGDVQGAATVLAQAKSKIKDKVLKEKLQITRDKIFVDCNRIAFDYYKQYASSKDKIYLDSAIFNMEVGITVRPDWLEQYTQKAFFYEQKGDTDKALATYLLYTDLMDKTFEFSISKKVHFNDNFSDAKSNLGPIEKKRLDTLKNEDPKKVTVASAYKFKIDSKDYFLYTIKEYGKDEIVKGFNCTTDPEIKDEQYLTSNMSKIDAYLDISDIYFTRKDLKNAIKYLKKVRDIDPTNKNAANYVVQLLKESGQGDEAYKEIEQLVSEKPNSKEAWAQYGDLLANDKNYEKAIEKYGKALQIDPEYDIVLYNIAAIYKNKAALIQASQDAGKTNLDALKPDLKQSAMYFERTIKTPKYKEDFSALSELALIYIALTEIDKAKSIELTLESLENTIDESKKQAYYYKMLNVTSNLKMESKVDEYSKKIEQLKK